MLKLNFLLISFVVMVVSVVNAQEMITMKSEITFVEESCKKFVEYVETCAPNIRCRFKIKIGNENYSYTFGTNGFDKDNICKMIFSDKQPKRTFVSIFDYNKDDIKKLKDVVNALVVQKGKFDLSIVEGCCNKDENATAINRCKLKINKAEYTNMMSAAPYLTCKGKKIGKAMEKEFKYND